MLCVPEPSGRGGARTPHEQGALLGHPDKLTSLQAWLVGPGLQGPHTDARRLWVTGQAVCPHLRADLSSGGRRGSQLGFSACASQKEPGDTEIQSLGWCLGAGAPHLPREAGLLEHRGHGVAGQTAQTSTQRQQEAANLL